MFSTFNTLMVIIVLEAICCLYSITLAYLSDKKFSKILNLIMAAIWAIAAILNVVGFQFQFLKTSLSNGSFSPLLVENVPFFRPKFAFFLELCIVLIVVLIYLTTIASYFMGFKGKIGGCFELYKRRKFRMQFIKKRVSFRFIDVDICINITNNIISNWGRK